MDEVSIRESHVLKPNALREKLEAGKPTLSTHIHSVWPAEIEVLGLTGYYDYVEFVAEYGSSGLFDYDNMCRAAELHDLGSMIKIDQSIMPFLAQRGIGAGFSSVLFTDVRNMEELRDCITAARPDHPDYGGTYGVATRRNSYPDYDSSAEYVKKVADTVLAFMIEKKGAVDILDEILAEPAVEMIQWGPSDYAMSIGRPGDTGHADVVAAEKKTFESAIKAGVAPRAEVGSADEIKRFLDMGVRHFSVGTDISILFQFWKDQGEQISRALQGE